MPNSIFRCPKTGLNVPRPFVPDPDAKAIDQAIRDYQAATTPAAIQKGVRYFKRRGHGEHINAASFRVGAVSALCDAIRAEIET
jgi:hypothetical protein